MALDTDLTVLVPVLTVIYAIGDFSGWWDWITGRDKLEKAYERLACGEGYPVSWIYDDDEEFEKVENFLGKRTKNPKLRVVLDQGHRPSLITFGFAGALEGPKPEDWPRNRFIPDTTPIVFVFGVTKGEDKQKGKLTWAASIAEFRRWIDEHRQTERFVVTVALIGTLSLLVAVLFA